MLCCIAYGMSAHQQIGQTKKIERLQKKTFLSTEGTKKKPQKKTINHKISDMFWIINKQSVLWYPFHILRFYLKKIAKKLCMEF